MSIEASFTPGPWSLDNNDVRDEAQAVVSDATGCSVAEAYTLDRPGDCEANAHLIAQSPAMYSFIERLIDGGGLTGWQEEEAEALLAASRGET